MITGMVTTITDVLNIWNDLGVFSYMIPFLLLFAVIFAILEKSQVLGENKSIMSIVAASIGLLALQFDFVSEFFAVIFPRFGIGISIFLVLIIMIGFFFPKGNLLGEGSWIGWTVGVGVVIWSLSEWDQWGSHYGFGGWFGENIWAIIVLAVLVTLIVLISRPSEAVRNEREAEKLAKRAKAVAG
ncbi:hypothetical protein KAI32_04365 [Candidatus Pacearchaeota archaeon]|nr:hypothetical protein [Candidatus Pacearchaeota archaeon]